LFYLLKQQTDSQYVPMDTVVACSYCWFSDYAEKS